MERRDVWRTVIRHRDLRGRFAVLAITSVLVGKALGEALKSVVDVMTAAHQLDADVANRWVADNFAPVPPPDGREPLPEDLAGDELAAARERLDRDAGDVEDALSGAIEPGDVTPIRHVACESCGGPDGLDNDVIVNGQVRLSLCVKCTERIFCHAAGLEVPLAVHPSSMEA
jgi:hypothetical protein